MNPVSVAIAGGPSADPLGTSPVQLERLLDRHGLLGHAHSHPHLSDAQRAHLSPRWVTMGAHSLIYQAERHRLLRGLTAAGFSVCFYKGETLQAWLDPTQIRASADLDFWVPPDQFRDVLRWLIADRYTLALGVQPHELASPMLPSELMLFHDSGMHLDVHQHFFAKQYCLDAADVVLTEAASAGSLSPLITAWLVCVSAGKDGFSSLRALSDVSKAVPKVSATELADLADRTYTRGLVDTAIAGCQTVLKSPLAWEHRWASRQSLGCLGGEEQPTLMAKKLAFVAARERLRDRIGVFLRAPLKPAATELDAPNPVVRIVRRTVRVLKPSPNSD